MTIYTLKLQSPQSLPEGHKLVMVTFKWWIWLGVIFYDHWEDGGNIVIIYNLLYIPAFSIEMPTGQRERERL